MATYWQAEFYKDGECYDFDFPRRETAEAALHDARERFTGLTTAEQGRIQAVVSEWIDDNGAATNTGRTIELEV